MSSDSSIESWLEAINLPEYVPILVDQGYDTLDKCATIVDKTALKDLGVTKVGHVNRLLRAIEKLRGETNRATTLPPNTKFGNCVPGDEMSTLNRTLFPGKTVCNSQL